MKLFFLLLMLSASAWSAEPVSANQISKQISEIEGVYKHHFMNGIITPGKAPGEADQPYESEDIVEIVRYDPTHIYFRAELQFYNGHTCSIDGIAGEENGEFVYHDSAPPLAGEPACTLRISTTADKLRITDRDTPQSSATCRNYCGARGSLSDYLIAKISKRKIRYLDKLKASSQYVEAVTAFKAKASDKK